VVDVHGKNLEEGFLTRSGDSVRLSLENESEDGYSVICCCPCIRSVCEASICNSIEHSLTFSENSGRLPLYGYCSLPRKIRCSRVYISFNSILGHTCGHPLSFKVSVATVKYPWTLNQGRGRLSKTYDWHFNIGD